MKLFQACQKAYRLYIKKHIVDMEISILADPLDVKRHIVNLLKKCIKTFICRGF